MAITIEPLQKPGFSRQQWIFRAYPPDGYLLSWSAKIAFQDFANVLTKMYTFKHRTEEIRGEKRAILVLSPTIAPIKVAVFLPVKRDGMSEIARKV